MGVVEKWDCTCIYKNSPVGRLLCLFLPWAHNQVPEARAVLLGVQEVGRGEGMGVERLNCTCINQNSQVGGSACSSTKA